MAPYAQGTTVSVEKTRIEIETLIKKHGATMVRTEENTRAGTVAIEFIIGDRRVRFVRKMPTAAEAKSQKGQWLDGETRRRWRALLLIIKAKLELVASGDVLFDEEFLPHIVGSNNMTIYETVLKMEAREPGLLSIAAVGESTTTGH